MWPAGKTAPGYAWLEVNKLSKNIRADLDCAVHQQCIVPHLAITCLDQVPEQFRISVGEHSLLVDAETLTSIVSKGVRLNGYLAFYGEGSQQPTNRILHG